MALGNTPAVRRFVAFARNSPWLMIAVGLHVIVAVVLSVVVIRHERRKAPPTSTAIAVAQPRAEPEPALPEPVEPDRHKIPEQELERELVTELEAESYVPSEEPPEEVEYSEPVGDPTGSEDADNTTSASTNIGVGKGFVRGSGPAGVFRGRPGVGNGQGKLGRHTPRTPVGTEESVLEGLRWLVRHQNEDGSWTVDTLARHCDPRNPCIPPEAELDSSFDVGMTSLALLAFLGHGITLSSTLLIADPVTNEARRAGDVVKKGIQWLRERQRPDGSFSSAACFELPENDTLPTMALCEASALSRGSNVLRRDAQRALDFLIAAQKRTPEGTPWGFGLGSQRDLDERLARGELDAEAHAEASRSTDLSITCWVVMALKSAKSCDFDVPDAALAGALAFGVDATVEAARGREPDAAADPRDEFTVHSARRAALGMLVRIFAGGDVDDPFLEQAAREIAADVPEVSKDGLSVDFYYWYFATLALNQYDGPDSPRAGAGRYWEPWNEGLVASLLPLQEPPRRKDACARGGWLQDARGNRRGRALYNTALNVLTLEVYYRFENVFGAAARERAGGR